MAALSEILSKYIQDSRDSVESYQSSSNHIESVLLLLLLLFISIERRGQINHYKYSNILIKNSIIILTLTHLAIIIIIVIIIILVLSQIYVFT